MYAGAYVYRNSQHRTRLVDGRLHTTYGHERPMNQWTVLLREHPRGYITWSRFEKKKKKKTHQCDHEFTQAEDRWRRIYR